MSSYIPLAAGIAAFVAMVYFGKIRDDHDHELRKSDLEHCRYGATLMQTLAWWWSRIRRT